MGKILEFKKDIVIGVLLFLIPFFLPLFGIGNDVSTLITATSTIFAIVAGFFIADAMSNYLRLQTLIAEEDAALISIADNAAKIDADRSREVHEAIDQYMIAQLSLGTLAHVFKTEAEIDRLGAAVNALRVKPEDGEYFDHILSMKENVISCRQEISLAAKNNLTAAHWTILIALSVLVWITVLAIRDGSALMNLVAGLMIVGTQAVLVLLREMDNNHLLEKKLSYDNPREVFHAIARPPYYPYSSPQSSRMPNEAGLYRLGREDQERTYDLVDAAKVPGAAS